jgi:hypothetical protein
MEVFRKEEALDVGIEENGKVDFQTDGAQHTTW